ncbi:MULTISPECIES: hypothetical protein [Acinetobacter]|uniref:hypothetical protein n=1 Tax=Acinetobacter TaxID=469 RepID=UPI00141B41D7|nr:MULTISPECIES: hypothetical protein [Acinetobacter]MCS4298707.1 hypothetical protein [Acinetobacter guillouiae]MCW2252555.1 hypothetical protein [Acinetobacter sp. BIGb0204]NII37858.1 hypothetical protein [Acinetobacter sp. BIGb0196]
MMKKIVLALLSFGFAMQTQAFDKTQVNLVNDFWGTWTVYNAKAQCTESYQFTQPDQFTYTTKQKRMTGDFAILRNENAQALDVLAMKVKLDNKKAGCGGAPVDYSNTDIRLSLKWISAKTAELCTDREGKQCTGLYLIKQK